MKLLFIKKVACFKRMGCL